MQTTIKRKKDGTYAKGENGKKGFKFTDETLLKMRLAKLGKPSNWKGKSPSDSTRLKMRLAKLGKKLSFDQLQKRKKRQLTPEQKQKISISLKGKHKSQEHRKNISLAKNKGITTINEKIRKSVEYKLWRTAVFERDNYICVFCGIAQGNKHADHIKPFAYYPELRFAIDNGRTLCVPCHRKTDTYGKQKKP